MAMGVNGSGAPDQVLWPTQPLRLGEVVDQTVSICRHWWKPLFFIQLPFGLMQFALQKLSEGILHRGFPWLGDPQGQAVALSGWQALWPVWVGAGSAVMLLGFAALFTSAVSGTAVLLLLKAHGEGGAPSPKEIYHLVRSRLGGILGAFLLSYAWLAAVFLAAWVAIGLGAGLLVGAATTLKFFEGQKSLLMLVAVLVFAAGMLLSLLPLLWFVLRFFLVLPVLAFEGEGKTAWQALGRAGALSRGRVGAGIGGLVKVRASVVLALVSAVLLIASGFFNLPATAVQFYFANPFVDPTAAQRIPFWASAPPQLAGAVLTLLVLPLWHVSKALFYFDVRLRREGPQSLGPSPGNSPL